MFTNADMKARASLVGYTDRAIAGMREQRAHEAGAVDRWITDEPTPRRLVGFLLADGRFVCEPCCDSEYEDDVRTAEPVLTGSVLASERCCECGDTAVYTADRIEEAGF